MNILVMLFLSFSCISGTVLNNISIKCTEYNQEIAFSDIYIFSNPDNIRNVKKILNDILETKKAKISIVDIDSYGRIIARIKYHDILINWLLVRLGLAKPTNKKFISACKIAKQNRIGAWKLKEYNDFSCEY